MAPKTARPTPYERHMVTYSNFVKETIASSTRPPRTLKFPGDGLLAHIAPTFKLWDPVTQYDQSPP